MFMIMNILIVLLMMFVESLDGLYDFPNFLKPYNLHIVKYPCPNCASWCKKLPYYTCNYTCDSIEYHGDISKGIGYYQLSKIYAINSQIISIYIKKFIQM
uniref:Uncharacterized protein n=1 Tax=Meloidogyne enterolobii TaxID=390850 RepID=A0A6V7VT88_MELEN|nr:unnamed protein product [Meloidogyne enterolobii]